MNHPTILLAGAATVGYVPHIGMLQGTGSGNLFVGDPVLPVSIQAEPELNHAIRKVISPERVIRPVD